MKFVRNALFGLMALTILPCLALIGLANRGAPPLPEVADLDPGAWRIGYAAMRDGRPEVAYDHLRRVPPDHPEYARAMRYCAWNVLANDLDRPKAAVAYVHESLRTDPFDDNVWEDLWRVYVRSALPFVDV